MTRTPSHASIRRHLLAGVALMFVVTAGIGGWAAATDLSGAVIAPGSLVVDSNVKKVQHPTGGVVGELRVRDGDRVRNGDIVMRLDDTVTKSNLAVVSKQLDELAARRARLEAERDGVDQITYPQDLLVRAQDPAVGHLLAGERKLFELRRTSRLGQQAQLRQRIAQLNEEIRGHTAQEAAKTQEVVFIKRELDGARELWGKNLMPISKLTSLEREATRLEGERAQLQANIAQSRGKIAETDIQIIQIDRDLGSEVAKDLREIDAKVGELIERKVAAEDQLKRVDIRAPQDGMVHQLSVHTVGGVINTGEVIMLIVPEADNLAVEVKVAPHEIEQLRLGQPALLRFSALNQRTTPELNGTVTRISADISTDQRTGQTYYTVRVGTTEAEVARLGTVKLVPGMPVEAFMQTSDRKVLSYLVKPLQDQIWRAFKER